MRITSEVVDARPWGALVGLLSLLVAGSLWIVYPGITSAQPPARTARTLNVTDEAHLHVTHSDGELLEEQGPATGALPGTVNVRFRIGASVWGTFTIYPRGGGSISGQGSGRLHSAGAYASFGGTTSVDHGTGPYARVHGQGGFYGTVNRRTNALVIQTTGRLSY